jgi:predicted Zn-dependent protease
VLNGEMTFRHGLYPEQRLILGASEQRQQLLDQAAHLRHWQRHERLVVGRTIGALALGGLAIILGCYFGLPRLAIALVDRMPQEWDSKLGDPIRESVLHRNEACTGAAGQTAIDQLGARLQPPTITTLPLTIDVVEIKDINAFALPGNHIVVFAGLIAKAETPEMLAGVLAHEMGHLEMRHPTRGVIEQLGLAAAINLLAGNNAISNLGQVMAGLSYTRDMERQADERAIALLHRADIRADGLAGFFEILKREEKLHLPAMLSDHPGLDDRVAATQQDARGSPAMSPAEWQAIKSMCGSSK